MLNSKNTWLAPSSSYPKVCVPSMPGCVECGCMCGRGHTKEFMYYNNVLGKLPKCTCALNAWVCHECGCMHRGGHTKELMYYNNVLASYQNVCVPSMLGCVECGCMRGEGHTKELTKQCPWQAKPTPLHINDYPCQQMIIFIMIT